MQSRDSAPRYKGGSPQFDSAIHLPCLGIDYPVAAVRQRQQSWH
jgi:hypothetical protein